MSTMTLRRAKEQAVRAIAFVAASATCLLLSAITVTFGEAAVSNMRMGTTAGALTFSAATVLLTLATLIFGKASAWALLWAPAFASRQHDDRQPPPELLGVPARLGPRGPSPLAAHAAIDLSENE